MATPHERPFEIVIVPMVMAELDALKVDRNEALRARAKKSIGELKEYRRRGEPGQLVTDGVPVRKGVSTMRWRAVEPAQATAPSWLDFANADDRFIASAYELVLEDPSALVVLASEDINLQNKAEFARLPLIESVVRDDGI